MNSYQILGTISMGLLGVALALSAYALTAHVSKKQIYVISFTVLALMITISILCTVIYSEYGHVRISSK